MLDIYVTYYTYACKDRLSSCNVSLLYEYQVVRSGIFNFWVFSLNLFINITEEITLGKLVSVYLDYANACIIFLRKFSIIYMLIFN